MSKPKGEHQRRRVYFIEKSFQAKFILKFCIIVACGGLLTIGLIYLFAQQSTTVSIVNSRAVVKSTADFLLPVLLQTVLIVMIFVSLATIAVTLFVSHKMSGPLYRFKEVMDALGEGDYLSDFKIRKLDQLQDFANAFNEMIRKMRVQINTLKDTSSTLHKKLGNISEEDVVSQKKQSLKELKGISEELDKTISRLKT